MRKKKKILFILPFFPYPMETGGHQALFNGISAVKEDFDIYIAYEACDNDVYKDAVNEFIRAIPNAILLPLLHKPSHSSTSSLLWYRGLSKAKTFIKKIVGIKESKITHEDVVMCSKWYRSISPLKKEWLEHIERICSSNQFDIIQVEMPWMISQILSLPEFSKKVFVHHEIGFVRRGLEFSQTSQSEYVKAHKRFADFNEIHLLNMYDAVITLSSIDAQKLNENGVHVPILSSFAVINSFADIQAKVTDGHKLVFIGPDRHNPNLVGINWFLDNCWEKLKNKDSSYQLYIIGKWSEDNIRLIKTKHQDVEFLGFVDNLQNAIKDSIMIVPITIGSGIRMKILEAASNGVPFVSTSVGAEGIPLINGEDCFITDSPEEFVDYILKLQDSETQMKFVKNANAIVREHFSLKALKNNRLNIYNEILKSN